MTRDQHLLDLPPASSADLVLASQKDLQHLSTLRSLLLSACEAVLGPQLQLAFTPELHLVADLAYFLLTVGLARQTLGEEFCDIIVSPYQNKVHKWFGNLSSPLLAAALALAPWFSARVQSVLPRKRLATFQRAVEILSKLHLTVFYFLGDFLSPVRRLFQARLYFSREPATPRPSYVVLGVFIILQFALEFGSLAYRAVRSMLVEKLALGNEVVVVPSLELESEAASWMGNCGICLSPLTSPACPPCGHVYCYACIVEASVSKNECPTCRQRCLPQTILCLH